MTGSYEEQLQKWGKEYAVDERFVLCISDYSGWNWNHESCEHYDEQYLHKKAGAWNDTGDRNV